MTEKIWVLTEKFQRVDNDLQNKLRALNPNANFGGWLTKHDRLVMEQILLSYPRKSPVILEVGVYAGGTSNILLIARPDAKFIGIDNWQDCPPGSSVVPVGYETMKDYFLAQTSQFKDRVELIEGDSIEIGQKWNRPLDILYIDGNHTYHYASADIQNFVPWVKQEGIIMVDDYDLKSVKQAVNENLLNHYELLVFPDLTTCEGHNHEKLIVFCKRVLK